MLRIIASRIYQIKSDILIILSILLKFLLGVSASRRLMIMKVPLLDLKEQNDALRPEIEAALGRVLDTNGFILGGEVAELEKELAAYCGTKYAIGCASGSDALLLAMMAFDIGPGDEVITTPYSFFATVSAITRLGATPVFVDIDPQTYNLDVSQVEAKITKTPKRSSPFIFTDNARTWRS